MKTARSFQLGGWPSWLRVRSNSAICQTGMVQLGGWPSWSRVRSSSAIRRAGLVQFGGWPSRSCCRSSSAIRRAGRISEDARILAKRQSLGSRIRVFDTMPRDVRDQCDGFRARPSPRYVLGLRDLYGRNQASLRGQFLNPPKVLTKISDVLYSAITLVSGVQELSLRDGLVCLGR
ncbi:hypothetical protein DY000_02040393 [Brassica cretica]|uniref:Uncharacterized protein n=1 Tax=Brassica cretica TaxID=69181 RepID=A0ABQ7BGD8_BRACR|nr:hypothetical protein DY000_02040393 [Brassica cretica]